MKTSVEKGHSLSSQFQRLKLSRKHLVQLYAEESVFQSHLRQTLGNENAPILQELTIEDYSKEVHSFLQGYFLNVIPVHFLSSRPQETRHTAQRCLAQWLALKRCLIASSSLNKTGDRNSILSWTGVTIIVLWDLFIEIPFFH